MSVTLYGQLVSPVWGTDDETGIIVDRMERVSDTEESLLSDGQGCIQHAAYFGANDTITADFKVKDTGYPAKDLEGATIVIANNAPFDGTYIVKSVTNSRTAGDWMSGNMNLRYFGWAVS